jgi:hypothetical protein
MKRLISRCSLDDPSSRPSFDAILEEFEAHRGAILPDVDCEEIGAAVAGVLTWEFDAGISRFRN